MLHPADFHRLLEEKGVNFFTGVPDSLLKDFCAYLTDNVPGKNHIIAANEGNATAIAAGRHLATGEISLVYLQNSGLGNIVNPAVSLLDPEVYSIPVLFLVGWRGRPGTRDEPQHIKQGRITFALLDVLGIRNALLPAETAKAAALLSEAFAYMKKEQAPFALVAAPGTFAPYKLQNKVQTNYPLRREEAIKLIVDSLGPGDVIVSTTGKTSRELYEYRLARGDSPERDFLTVGSMGHASQIALGIALAKPKTQVFCLDGDGALLMHMGGAAVIAGQAPPNFKHIVLNNGAHDSVGGQPTCGFAVDIPVLALACGYKTALRAESPEEIKSAAERLRQSPGPALLEIRINKGARKDLGRPKSTPVENKKLLMQFLAGRN
jgi:phosphonopyruvate decarboxylase